MEEHYRRIVVLLWADMFAGYVIWIMQTYLTDVWKLGFTHAAGIQNVFGGLTKALPFFFVLFVDAFLRHKWMLVFSSIAYTVGLGLLSMSTPPVLSKSIGTCSEYKPECLGRTQKSLFYTSLALVAVGISGHIASLVTFASKQMRREEEYGQADNNASTAAQNDPVDTQFQPVDAMISLLKDYRKKSFRIFLVLLVPVIGIIALPYVNPWSIRFGVPAICTLVATILFLSGFCCGVYDQEGENTWRLFTVSEVTKITIRMMPFWISFIISGVMTSIGNTYFVEQANHMNYKVGKLEVPITILLVLYEYSRLAFSKLFSGKVNSRYAPAVGIIFSVLCCITASKVETRRIGVITDHGLLDKPDEKIPMTAFWLLPQYFLLAGHDWIMENSIAGFCGDEASATMQKYIVYITQAVTGIGIAGSVLSVYIVGRVSERGGQTNWFQETLNKSRLDNYYWVLAVLGAANFVWYVFAAAMYRSN